MPGGIRGPFQFQLTSLRSCRSVRSRCAFLRRPRGVALLRVSLAIAFRWAWIQANPVQSAIECAPSRAPRKGPAGAAAARGALGGGRLVCVGGHGGRQALHKKGMPRWCRYSWKVTPPSIKRVEMMGICASVKPSRSAWRRNSISSIQTQIAMPPA